MMNSDVVTYINYGNIEIPVSHTLWGSDKIKPSYSQRVSFNFKGINVMYSYKSDEISPYFTVEKICKLIDIYGLAWKEHMEENVHE